MIASVIGSVIVIFVPMPTSLVMSTTPPSFAMFVLATSRPTPRPLRSVAISLVVKPGMKTRREHLARRQLPGLFGRKDSAPHRGGRARVSGSIPRPSSSTSMTTWLPFWNALSAMVPIGGLPTRRRSSRGSMP